MAASTSQPLQAMEAVTNELGPIMYSSALLASCALFFSQPCKKLLQATCTGQATSMCCRPTPHDHRMQTMYFS